MITTNTPTQRLQHVQEKHKRLALTQPLKLLHIQEMKLRYLNRKNKVIGEENKRLQKCVEDLHRLEMSQC